MRMSYRLLLPLSLAAVALAGLGVAQDSSGPAQQLDQATKDQPYFNSLGMKFVPVRGTKVLFCIWETRIQDYAMYASENPGISMDWKDHEYNGVGQEPFHPVVMVDWTEAKSFCEWLSQTEGITYRLPTDHEWSVAVGIGDLEDPSALPSEKARKTVEISPGARNAILSIEPPMSAAPKP